MTSKPAPPPPLVKLGQNPKQWFLNKALLLAAAVIFAYIGQLAFTGLYFIATQWWEPLTILWHHMVSNSELRHSFRNHGEGLFGGLFGVAVVWNHYRKIRPLNMLDKFEISHGIANIKDDKPLSGKQFSALIILVPLYAVSGYFIARGALYAVHHVPFIWSHVHNYWMSSWDERIVGYGMAFFFGRRPAKGVFDDLQLWVAERIITFDRPDHPVDFWWLLPNMRARCNELRSNEGTAAEVRHTVRWSFGLGFLVFVVVSLAIFGLYVITFIA